MSQKTKNQAAHINQKDVEDALLGHYGIKQAEDNEKRVPKICPTCKNLNSFDTDICDNCTKPLNLEKAIEIEEEEQKEKEKPSSTIEKLEFRLVNLETEK